MKKRTEQRGFIRKNGCRLPTLSIYAIVILLSSIAVRPAFPDISLREDPLTIRISEAPSPVQGYGSFLILVRNDSGDEVVLHGSIHLLSDDRETGECAVYMMAAPEGETRLETHCPSAAHDSYRFTLEDAFPVRGVNPAAPSETSPDKVVKP